MSQVQLQLAKLKEAEEKAKTTIQAIQQQIDESAKEMATQNAEHQKRKQDLEIGKKLALQSVVEKCQKEIGQLEEKYETENAELEAKNWERNANYAKEMTSLKEQLKEKINWNQVDLVMGKKQPNSIVPLNPRFVSPIGNVNSKGNRWDSAKSTDSFDISTNGLNATATLWLWRSVYAENGFNISADFSAPVLYYYEVTNMSLYKSPLLVGISSENIPNGTCVGRLPNSYAIAHGYDRCWLSGKSYPFEWPNDAIKPEWNGQGDVVGCGLLLNSEKEVSIFFTANGILMGNQIPIKSTANYLCPTVSMKGLGNSSVAANFGDDSAKPFSYDIVKCPGMIFK